MTFLVLASLLALAGGPESVCVGPGRCTVVRRSGLAEGVPVVSHPDRLPTRVDARRPFAAWLTWTEASSGIRTRVLRGEAPRLTASTLAAGYEIQVVPAMLVRNGARLGLLAFLSVDPLRGVAGGPALPEAVLAARDRNLLSTPQLQTLEDHGQKVSARSAAIATAWTTFARAPRELEAGRRLLEAIAAQAGPELDPLTFLTPAQRTRLRADGLAVDGRIVLEDGRAAGVAFRLNVEACPASQIVREWNAGLRGLVGRLERVPRSELAVPAPRRHEEASFILEVRSDGDVPRVSQVTGRLLALPGITATGNELPAPVL